MSNRPKIVIIDDHEAARMGIAALLGQAGFCVVGLAADGKEAIELITTQSADAVLSDVRMAVCDGLATLELIRSQHGSLPVVLLSAYENPTYVARAAAMGANDYILKNGSHELLFESLRRAIEGQSPLPGSRLTAIRNKLDGRGNIPRLSSEYPLTNRESQVLVHVAFGLSNKEIASSLKISVETVKEHVQNVLRKLKANDRTDAAVRAVRMGIVD